MAEPRLRTVNKATAPFDVNKFPSSLVDTLAKNVVYMMATKQSMSLEGNEWEQIFAECVGADWKPSNVGLDDVVLDNCCWGTKTVFGQADIENQDKVRLICGRNAVTYSFGVDNYKFTWQPGGSQFTIIEDIPKERLHISVKEPEPIDRETLLETIHFDKSWYKIVSERIPDKTDAIRQQERINAYVEKLIETPNTAT